MLRIPVNRVVESIFVPMKSKDGYYILDFRGFVLKTKISDIVDKKLFLETFYNYYVKTLNYKKIRNDTLWCYESIKEDYFAKR